MIPSVGQGCDVFRICSFKLTENLVILKKPWISFYELLTCLTAGRTIHSFLLGFATARVLLFCHLDLGQGERLAGSGEISKKAYHSFVRSAGFFFLFLPPAVSLRGLLFFARIRYREGSTFLSSRPGSRRTACREWRDLKKVCHVFFRSAGFFF